MLPAWNRLPALQRSGGESNGRCVARPMWSRLPLLHACHRVIKCWLSWLLQQQEDRSCLSTQGSHGTWAPAVLAHTPILNLTALWKKRKKNSQDKQDQDQVQVQVQVGEGQGQLLSQQAVLPVQAALGHNVKNSQRMLKNSSLLAFNSQEEQRT